MSDFKKTARQSEAIATMKGKAKHVLLYGGSRSGKTAITIYAMIIRALKKKSRHGILRSRFSHAKTSVGHGSMPEILDFMGLGSTIRANKSDWFWPFPNGSEIWLAGLDDKERTEKVLGTEYSTLLFEEISQMTYDSVITALTRLSQNSGLNLKAYFTENPPLKKHWSYRLWIEGIDPADQTPVSVDDYAHLQMNPRHNEANLPPDYIESLAKLPERKRKRFYEGAFQDDIEGALWSPETISAYRVQPADVPDLVRIVVGVDPNVTDSKSADECGIVAVGRDAAGHLYVIDDRSINAGPMKWGVSTIACYKDNRADRVIGEVNNGGDLVEMNLRHIDATVSYKSVHASRGKIIRAEPVSSMYEQGLVHHVGQFPELEDEMCSFTGDKNDASPNRMDALVWAVTEVAAVGTPHVWSTVDDRAPVEQRIDAEIDELMAGMTPQERAIARKVMEDDGL